MLSTAAFGLADFFLDSPRLVCNFLAVNGDKKEVGSTDGLNTVAGSSKCSHQILDNF